MWPAYVALSGSSCEGCYKLVRPLQNRASKQQIVDSFGDSQWSGGFAGAGEYFFKVLSLSFDPLHMYTDNIVIIYFVRNNSSAAVRIVE